jgi:hypothetical protein
MTETYRAVFHAMTQAEQIEAVRALADEHRLLEHDIAMVTGWSVLLVRRALDRKALRSPFQGASDV